MELDLSYSLIKPNEFDSREYQKRLKEIHEILHESDHSIGTTWVDWPKKYDAKELNKILKLAKHVEETSDVLLVCGIGGSYLGARSSIDLLASRRGKVQIMFVGTSLDYTDLSQKLEEIKNKDVTVNVVSKSGTTVEILSTLNIIERFMKNKYKGEYKSRMIFTTDRSKGYLREKANQEGIETLRVPDGMGGRYSVLSAVGLLPLACAGVNIKKIMEGALAAYEELNNANTDNIANRYAIYRYLLNKKLGRKLELFASFSKKFSSFGDFLQQLFTESEGKNGKGLFCSSVSFTTDLHSVGQFIQQGSPILAETFINVKSVAKDNLITNVELGSPIKFLDGKNFSELSKAAFDGTVKAHADAGVPIVIISIDEINEYNYGYLVYFFELACATSGYLLGVNPFNQPGVEQYKSYMKENLKNS